MARLIEQPAKIDGAGNKPKVILEHVGRLNTGTSSVSIARMLSPQGWIEPGQTPEFDEFTLVLRGMLRVTTKTEVLEVRAGQSVHVLPGEWVRYDTPEAEGAEYVAVCLPAFSSETVHRDPD